VRESEIDNRFLLTHPINPTPPLPHIRRHPTSNQLYQIPPRRLGHNAELLFHISATHTPSPAQPGQNPLLPLVQVVGFDDFGSAYIVTHRDPVAQKISLLVVVDHVFRLDVDTLLVEAADEVMAECVDASANGHTPALVPSIRVMRVPLRLCHRS
jgi:hypothetical protein